MIKEIYEIIEQAKEEKTDLDRAYQVAVAICEKIEPRGGIVIGRHGSGFLMYEVKRLDGPPRTGPGGVPIIEKREGVFGWLPTLVKNAEPTNEDLFEDLRALDLEIFRVRTPKISNLRNRATVLFTQWLDEQIVKGGTE